MGGHHKHRVLYNIVCLRNELRSYGRDSVSWALKVMSICPHSQLSDFHYISRAVDVDGIQYSTPRLYNNYRGRTHLSTFHFSLTETDQFLRQHYVAESNLNHNTLIELYGNKLNFLLSQHKNCLFSSYSLQSYEHNGIQWAIYTVVSLYCN